jgi:hypothetical protein
MGKILIIALLNFILISHGIGQKLVFEELPSDSSSIENNWDFYNIPELREIIGDSFIQVSSFSGQIILNDLSSNLNKGVLIFSAYEYPYSRKGNQITTPIKFVYGWTQISDSISKVLKDSIIQYGVDTIPSSEKIDNWDYGNGCSPDGGFIVLLASGDSVLRKGFSPLLNQSVEIEFISDLTGFSRFLYNLEALKYIEYTIKAKLPYRRTFNIHGGYTTKIRFGGKWRVKRFNKRQDKLKE